MGKDEAVQIVLTADEVFEVRNCLFDCLSLVDLARASNIVMVRDEGRTGALWALYKKLTFMGYSQHQMVDLFLTTDEATDLLDCISDAIYHIGITRRREMEEYREGLLIKIGKQFRDWQGVEEKE